MFIVAVEHGPRELSQHVHSYMLSCHTEKNGRLEYPANFVTLRA